MAMTWTDEQRQVIESREADLLVSAAAGSGKTAVLVERILELVTDPVKPLDIDRLLVVTFTRAAAAEMRERIGKALELRLSETPDDLHLQRQSTLLQHAQISTIHSFCTAVIQNYSHCIDLDPGYRVADEGELRMLRGKVMKEYLENEYTENTEDFCRFAEAFSPGKNDSRLETLIQKVYDFSVSDPDPESWLDSVLCGYEVRTEEELMALPWMILLREETGRRLEGIQETAEEDLRLAELPGGPDVWIPALRQDLETVRLLRSAGCFAGLQRELQDLAFTRLPPKKAGPDEDPEIREKIRAKREGMKKALQSLKEDYYSMTAPEILRELARMHPYVHELVRLVKGYGKALAAAKQKKNICDFSDLEHYALSILIEKDENGKPHPTQAARELACQYDEIMIDEYQDSNYIQEALLSAVAGAGTGRRNRFMVGDIKQSIYGFRNARPELFLEKYRRYGTGQKGGGERRIDLHRNFRSRTRVLDSVNVLFRELMQESLGGITYDDSAALYPGAVYPDAPAGNPYGTELLLSVSADPETGETAGKSAAIEAEAYMTARRIRELMGSLQVSDGGGGLRPLQYRDCVVLLRSAAGWADTFVRVLKDNGIPAYTLSREGYFSSVEIVTVLNCLRIIDNPRQEIPFAAVLRSPVAGCTDRDLALLAIRFPRLPVYEAAAMAAEENAPAGSELYLLSEKLQRFFRMLEGWREEAPVIAVHDLISRVMEESGYGVYAAAMPAGAQRQANLRMLLEKAVVFEQTDAGGLFSFIRYIERMQKYSVDDGEVSLYSEAENIVRVTTIHKSKGLEYPVVFVSGLGKQFNLQDQNSPLVLHPEMGIGLYVPDLEFRVRKSSLLRQVIRMAGVRDLQSEELRILYVAMTRAKEKLILTGTVKDASDLPEAAENLTYRQLATARSPLDWILQAGAFLDGTDLRISDRTSREESEGQAAAVEGTFRDTFRDILHRGAAAAISPDARELLDYLEQRDAFRYPYEEAASLPAKMSVTEIKKASVEAMMEEKGESLYPEETIIPYIPKFMREADPETAAGAARGTIYHHVMELLDYSMCALADNPEEEKAVLTRMLDKMAEKGRLKKAETGVADPADLQAFLRSGIGQRMKNAALRGKLWREKPFVIDLPAKEIDKNWPEEENILVQGVIDAWFEEEGSYVIVDYKTDKVFSADGHELAEKYAPQLLLYRRALESLTGVEVKEMWLYSFALGREIPVEGII